MNCDGYRDGEDCEEEDLKLYWVRIDLLPDCEPRRDFY
jgi:hypothetical protein